MKYNCLIGTSAERIVCLKRPIGVVIICFTEQNYLLFSSRPMLPLGVWLIEVCNNIGL